MKKNAPWAAFSANFRIFGGFRRIGEKREFFLLIISKNALGMRWGGGKKGGFSILIAEQRRSRAAPEMLTKSSDRDKVKPFAKPDQKAELGKEEVSLMRIVSLSILVLITVIVRLCGRYDGVKSHAPERI